MPGVLLGFSLGGRSSNLLYNFLSLQMVRRICIDMWKKRERKKTRE